MPANLRRTESLSESQENGIRYMMKSLGIDASVANRMFFEYVYDNCPDLAEHVVEREITEYESRLSEKRELLNLLRQRKAKMPELCIVREKPTSREVSEQKPKTPDELIMHYLPDLGKNTATGRIALKRIQEILETYQDKIALIPENLRHHFKQGGGQ